MFPVPMKKVLYFLYLYTSFTCYFVYYDSHYLVQITSTCFLVETQLKEVLRTVLVRKLIKILALVMVCKKKKKKKWIWKTLTNVIF